MGYGNYIIEAPGYEELEELRGAVKAYLKMGGFPYTESVPLGNPRVEEYRAIGGSDCSLGGHCADCGKPLCAGCGSRPVLRINPDLEEFRDEDCDNCKGSSPEECDFHPEPFQMYCGNCAHRSGWRKAFNVAGVALFTTAVVASAVVAVLVLGDGDHLSIPKLGW